MSKYTVTSIPLPPIAGIHGGTGTFQNPNGLVVPSSVPGTGKLQFVGQWVQVTTMLFQLSDDVVPNWFGVAIPEGIKDFSKAHIFFHPMPAQAGYKDTDYRTKSGKWPELFYYMERLGYQLDGAARSQIIIMPFLKNSATDTGIFLANWFDIVTDILTAVRAAMGADDGSTLQLTQVAISSFSIGIVYSSNFRTGAPNLSPFLAEVWDFDGLFSSSPQLSRNLVSTAQYQAIKYDQDPSAGPASFHVPWPRWSDYVDAPTTPGQTHSLIRDFMFLHAASISTVGATIQKGGTPDPGVTPDPGGTPAPGLTPDPGVTPEVIPPPVAQPAPPVPAPATPAPVPVTPIPHPVVPPHVVPHVSPRQPQSTPGGTPPGVPIPAPWIPGGTVLMPHHEGCGCECCCAIAGIVANVATTATTAIMAITAISSIAKK